MIISSKILQDAVEGISNLPGIGKKSALRIALHLLNGNLEVGKNLASNLIDLENVKFCKKCHNISDHELCNICTASTRDNKVICVVENIRDVIAIENTQQFNGVYHVLGGLISPLEGVSPEDINIQSLVDRIKTEPDLSELIMAISPTIEGETTIYYISNLLPESTIISMISRGVSFGGELEYADELTLGRSILTRIPYGDPISNK